MPMNLGVPRKEARGRQMTVAQPTAVPGIETTQTTSGDARLRALLASITDAVITVDGRGAIESVNPAAELLFGYGADDLTGASFAALLGDPHRDEYSEILREFGGGKAVQML